MQMIRTAICSFGMSGKVFHAPFIDLHPGFQLYAVWERSKKAAAAIYPNIISYDSYEAMLADSNIDLVVVNTPNVTHYEHAKQALLAGKHVVVEKPFTATVAEAFELEQLADKQDRIISVYHNRRFDSGFKTLQRIIESGVLGEIKEAEFHFDRYNLNISPKLHKETAVKGTGIVYDLGSHIIDQALTLFGMPEAVFGDIQIQRSISQVDDYFEILLFYPHMRVRLKGGYLIVEPVPAHVLHGTKGSFLKSHADVQEAMLIAGHKPEGSDWGTEPASAKGLLVLMENGQPKKELVPSEQGNYMEFYDGLYNAISSNIYDGHFVPAGDGANVIRIIEAAYQSRDEKKIVEL
ncbi:Gfo/Idh/MocA family oxidoreductase [Pseudoflavitalea sp. G-6-1-2]|uniref:Gfo/Idh/MocA family oxidoreductase n=1 Tax=Pseudoflavitalea sp. G-6-1-2 TaxID=2728841 RepID=UPI00146E284D|nr:Gfo/Idh/MocA family oxidoreductase [Pseudoflavitalea sp. G-6-1-2]NML22217.1 Gfo/Idh/MocA family oxidoreductase [Pseudoflavitalea sp. G-6-1-2]